MIRALRALAWLRWRLLVNGFRKSRRDALERASRLAAVAVPAFLAVLAIPAVLTLAAAAFVGGLLSSGPDAARIVVGVSRGILAVLTLAVLIGPLVRSIQGATLGLARLTLLPISRRVLHLAEIGAGMADPWILGVLPSLLTLPAGLLLSGSPAAAGVVLAAGIAFAIVLATLAAASSFAVALLLRNRRRGEWVTLVFIAVLSMAGFLPALLSQPGHARRARDPIESASRANTGERPRLALPVWTRGMPSELYTGALGGSLGGRPAAALPLLGGLAGTALALYGLSWLAYRRLVETPAGGGGKRRVETRGAFVARIPGLSSGVSAVALAELRLVLRTVRGKSAVFLTPAALAVLAFMGGHGDRLDPHLSQASSIWGGVLPWAAALFSVIALHPFLLNQFATDGSGLSLEFLSPLSDRDLVRGKAAGLSLVWALILALCITAGAALGPSTRPVYWASAAIGAASVLALLMPVAAAFSALFPKAADLGRIGRSGNPHPTAGVAGGLLTLALGLPPAGLTALGIAALRSDVVALALVTGWAVIASVAGYALLRTAAAVLARRRENLALVAEGR